MFDTARYLEENFGSPDGVIGLASKHNVRMAERDTIRKWFERNDIPGKWVNSLHLIVQRETGEPVDVERYFVTEASNDIFA